MLRTSRLVALLTFATGAAAAQPRQATLTERPSLNRVPQRWPPAQRLQGLPLCAPGTPFPPPGAPFPCRWPLPPGGPEVALSLGVGTGLVRSDALTTGSLLQVEAQADVFVHRAFGFGVRYRFLNGQTEGDRATLELHPLSAGLRLRVFTNESRRESWTFEPEGGYALATGGRAQGGPFVGLSVVRNLGAFFSEGGSHNLALVLAGLQGLGALSEVRLFTVGLRFAPSFNAHAPRDLDEPQRPAALHYTFGLKWFMVGGAFGAWEALTLSPGAAVTFGLPVTRWLEPLVQVDLAYWLRAKSSEVPAPLVYSFLGGARVRLNGVAPLYVSALAGWQVVAGRAPLSFGDGVVVDLGFGLNLPTCGGALQIGTHYRRGVSHDATDFNAVMLVMGGTYGSRVGSNGEAELDRGSQMRCGSSPESVRSSQLRSDGAAARLGVALPPVEVVIGGALFGGLVQFHLDPAVLPLDRLVRAGRVAVRIEGPPEALPQAAAELNAALTARGITVHSSATVAVGGASQIRAVFTLWPSGAP